MRAGTIIADRFRIEQLAGRGGMAAVYRARDLARDVDVAIKVGHVAGPSEARRMVREAQALAEHLLALRHPHIVEYVAHGVTADDQVYLAMEWLEGHDLGKRLAHGPLAEGEVVTLAWRLAHTLSVVHGCGIVHRDIKPGNVFLVDGELARVKLIDFGLVSLGADATRMTPSGVYLGTPGFMAPEQIREPRAVDGRTDLYALGVLMFACLTRRLPFEGAHIAAVLAGVLLEEAPRVRDLSSEVSPALDELIARLLAKSPDERPASAEVLVTELERLDPTRADGGPLAARMAVSYGEQRFFTVLLAGPIAPAMVGAVAAALAERAVDPQVEVVRLTDSTALAMFTGDDTLERTAARAARSALALRASGLNVPIVLATGRGSTNARLPVGEVVERAAALRFGPAQRAAHREYVLIDTLGHIVAPWEQEDTLPASADATVPMSETAQAGILVDEVSAHLLEKRFAIAPGAGPGFELHGELTGAPAERMPTQSSGPCLGRERELARLAMLLDECIESSAPRVVLVGGAPGMGKSRLADELVLRHGAHVRIWRAGGDPAHVGSSLRLLARLVLDAVGARHLASPSEHRAALDSRVRARIPPHEASRVVVFLSEIAGLPHPGADDLQLREARRDPRLMHDQMLRAWEDWLDAEAAAGPVALILDDLQWADAPSVRFIERALCHLEARPIFALGLARHESDELLPELWSACHPDRMSLRPLPAQVCEALAQHHAPRALSPEALARIVERAGGNPFYVEELVRQASSGEDTAVPDTLLALIAMRLAALPADERRILRAASVFGRRFLLDGLAALIGDQALAGDALRSVLERLIARNLVLPERRAHSAGEGAYRFRHDLVREAAYAMLLDDDRVRAHHQAAVWLEQAGERDSYVLAEHYRLGNAPAQALPWYCRAAEQALAADDMQAVLRRVEHAIACGASGEALGTLRRLQAEAQNWSGQHQAAHAAAIEAMACLPRGSDAWLQAAHQRSWASFELGDGDDVARVVDELLACRTESLGDAWVIAMARCVIYLRMYGHHQQASQLVAELEPQARMDVPPVAGTIWHISAMSASIDGRPDTAAVWFMRAIEQWNLIGHRRQACLERVNVGSCLHQLGRYEESMEAYARSLDEARRMNIEHLVEALHRLSAENLARQGLIAEAEQLIRYTPHDSHFLRALHATSAAWLAVFASRPAHALAEADRALALTEKNPMMAEHAVALTIRARALHDLGRAPEALTATRAAMELMQAPGYKKGKALLHLTHAEALHATGMHDQARATLAMALAWLRDMALHIENPEWRESFLHRVAENRRILELARAWGIDQGV